MTRYVVAFEVAGLLLTAALVGAIALAHREGDDQPRMIRSRANGQPRSPDISARGWRRAAGDGLAAHTEVLTPPAR